MLNDSNKFVHFYNLEKNMKKSSIMSVTANKKFWTEFIDIYHSLPSLWNTKDENYNNRDCRTFAWNKLVQKMREVEPDANQDSVKRKINTYRSNFNREVRKIRQSQRDQPGEVYNPTLWYFDHLSFLLSQEKCNNTSMDDQSHDEEMTLMNFNSTKNAIKEENTTMSDPVHLNQQEIAATEEEQNQHHENDNCNNFTTRLVLKKHKSPEIENNHTQEYLVPTIEVLPNESTNLNQTSRFQASCPAAEMPTQDSEHAEETITFVKASTNRKLRLLPNKRSKRLKSQDPYMRNTIVSSALNDEAAIYGQSWACGFRKLSPQQKLFAKKAIDEILILGQLEALKFNTVSMTGHFMETGNNDEG